MEQTVKFPIWFEPSTKKAPMSGVRETGELLSRFLARYPNCYPPMVLNLTDGQPTDANPRARPRHRGLGADGNVVLFNAHLSSEPATPILFPSDEKELKDPYARLLFRISSLFPTPLRAAAKDEGFVIDELSRGFVFNGDLVSVVRFLEIGTRVANRMK